MNGLPVGEVACMDAVAFLKSLPDSCLDAVITDPPYAEVDRPYGRLTEAEWWALIVEGVIPEVRRALKPQGSAVFIIQPNSRKVGSMRGWVFEFMAWVCREWNMVQDCYWWNTTTPPSAFACQGKLMRPAAKPNVWCGAHDCYRDQSEVLWSESDSNVRDRLSKRWELQYKPGGQHVRTPRVAQAAADRGGVTPFNVLPVPNANSVDSAGSNGHGAGTPLPLMRWWTRYIVPPGGVVGDCFMGSGTLALAAIQEGRDFVGCERDEGYCRIARDRIAKAQRAHQDRLDFGPAEEPLDTGAPFL